MTRFIVPWALVLSCMAAQGPGATATHWIHRSVVVGRARAESSLDELTLEIEGNRATLVVSEKRAPEGGFRAQPPDLPFREVRRTTLRGAARTSGHALELALSSDSGKTTLHCTYERRGVATANAVRVPDPSFQSECGNRGAWMPPEQVEVDALVCAFDAIGADTRRIAFGRAPGIELLGVSEGCFIQGEAERLVPEDGSLAPAFARSPR